MRKMTEEIKDDVRLKEEACTVAKRVVKLTIDQVLGSGYRMTNK